MFARRSRLKWPRDARVGSQMSSRRRGRFEVTTGSKAAAKYQAAKQNVETEAIKTYSRNVLIKRVKICA